MHQAFIEAGGLVINILAQDQKDTAIRFASKVPDRFDGVQWVTGTTGLPVLAQHAAYFECVLDSAIPAGDHTIFVGRVIAIGDTEAAPLGFHSGSFKRVSCDDLASSSA
ncbi:hypothetical protein CS8_048180 [Cupriavidus sp. 8B]